MTEETRKQLRERSEGLIAILQLGGHISFPQTACCVVEEALRQTYELGEKAGRSAQKAEDNSYGNGTCSGVDLVG